VGISVEQQADHSSSGEILAFASASAVEKNQPAATLPVNSASVNKMPRALRSKARSVTELLP
jgi:hypothetical protein